MYPLQGPTGEPKQEPPEPTGLFDEAKAELLGEAIAIIGFLLTTYFIALRQTNTDLRLPVLHGVIRGLQATARVLGGWAIDLEKTYNDIVETLH